MEETMDQLHKRFIVEQIKVLFQGYCQGMMTSDEIEKMLNIGKTHFFALLKDYQQDPQAFSIAYQRKTCPGYFTHPPAMLGY